jgi:hypothetical protein
MASDVVLVLRSEHRRLARLSERSRRSSRGLEDPRAELRRAVGAHAAAGRSELLPGLAGWPEVARWEALLDDVVEACDEHLPAVVEACDEHLPAVVEALVTVEKKSLLPWLGERTSVDDRRRLGTLYRVRRDMAARAPASRPGLTRTELYERARRAGVENRSRMTQAELRAAVEEWERQHASRMA